MRLARTRENDFIGKRNLADLKSDERRRIKETQCIWKNSKKCDNNCESCNIQQMGRFVTLDEGWLEDAVSFGDSERTRLTDPALIYEGVELRETINRAMSKLSADERRIISIAFWDMPSSEAARRLGIPRTTFEYRRNKIIDKLRRYLEDLVKYEDV